MSYKSIRKDKKIYSLYNFFLIGFIVNSLSVVTNTEIERIAFSYLYFGIIVLGFAVKNMKFDKSFLRWRVKFFSGFYSI